MADQFTRDLLQEFERSVEDPFVLEQKFQLRQTIQTRVEETHPESKVIIFGSSMTG